MSVPENGVVAASNCLKSKIVLQSYDFAENFNSLRGLHILRMCASTFHAIAHSFMMMTTIIVPPNAVIIADRQLPPSQLAVTEGDNTEDLYIRVKHRCEFCLDAPFD